MKNKIICLIILALIAGLEVSGQTPGMIIKQATGAGKAVLDPDGDGYVSKKTPPVTGVQIGFVSNDIAESEIPYAAIVKPDPQGDILNGPTCGFSDIVGTDAAGNNGIMAYYDGTNFLFRFRIGRYSTNSKGYSLLIDTDQKFGFTGPNADPNAVPGNPGFEVEIVLETNFGVEVYNVDGTASPVLTTPFSTNPYSVNCQKSIALTTACSDPDYFYDFYIPISQLTSIAGLGITANTPFRIVATTNMSPHASIGSSSVSDVGGVTSGSNLDLIYSSLIDAATPTSINNINSTGMPDRSACPGINNVAVGNATITGTSTEASGTVINVYVYQSNGTTLVGSGTTTTSGTTWTINVSALSPAVTLTAGYKIKATATASGKGTSYDSCNPVTVTDCSSQTSVPVAAEVIKISGGKGYTISAGGRPVGTKVYLYTSDYALRAVTDLKNSTSPAYTISNPFTTTASVTTFNFECQTGNCFGSDVYYFRFEEPGKCISPYYLSCDYATGGTSASPTISTNPITTSTTTISGNGTAAGSQINIYANGTQIATTTSGALSPFAFSATVTSLSLCQVITARQIVSPACLSAPSAGVTVTRQAYKPVITFTGCSATSPVTSISGFSAEADGTTITLYTPNSSGTSLGTTTVTGGAWTKSGLSLTSGTIIVAKVTSGSCVTPSADSNPVTISTQTNISSYTIGITTPTEGQTSVSGTISSGTYPVTLKVYIDQAQVGSGIVVNSAGSWTVSGLNLFDLATGSKVQVTLTGTGCESALSTTYATVQCQGPASKTISSPGTTVCYNTYGTVTVQNSESGIIYTLVASDGVTTFGYSAVGTGSDLNLQTNKLLTNPTVVKVKASKFPIGSCDNLLSGSVSFTVNPLPSAPTAGSPQTYCGSGTTTLADLAVTVPPGCSLKWYNASTGGTLLASSTSLVNGTTYYAESLLTATGCTSSTRTAVLVQSGTPQAPAANPSQSFCPGATVANLVATLSGPGSISWFSSSSGGSALATSATLVNSSVYYAETSQNSCVSSSRTAVTVTIIPVPTPTFTSEVNSVCQGSSGNLYTTQPGNSNYVWSVSAGGTITSGGTSTSNSVTVTWNTAGSQTVSVNYSNGSCSAASPTVSNVTVSASPTPTFTAQVTSACAGSSGNIYTTESGKSNYVWIVSSGGTITSGGSGSDNTATVTWNSPGSQSISVNYSNGTCSAPGPTISNVTVTSLPAAPTAGATLQPTCSVATGTITVTAPAEAGMTYSIDGSTYTNTTGIFTSVLPGTYTVTAKNSTGCISPGTSVTINPQPLTPTLTTGTITNPATCGTNGSIVLNFTNVPDGTYTISHSSGSFSGVNVASGTATILTDAGTYNNLQITVNGCTSSSGVDASLVDPSAPPAPIVGLITQPTCGISTGSVALSGLPGSGSWTLTETTGSTTKTGTGTSGTFNGLVANTYTFTVTNAAGCTSVPSENAIINVQPATPATPAASATLQPTCSVATGTITVTAPTETGMTYSIDGSTYINTSGIFTSVSSGTYTVTARNSDGCTSAGTSVTINSQPATPAAPTVSSASQSFCLGISPKVSDLNASGSSIQWYDAATAGNLLPGTTALVNGTSYYASQTAGGCESTSRTAVSVTILSCTGPVILDNSVAINENSANGTVVYNVNDNNTGNDKDPDGNSITYSITGGNSSGAFTIDPSTGVISVANSSILDYETITSFVLIVHATNGSLTDDASITVNLNNINDNNPVSVNDTYTLNEGGTISPVAPGLLGNDSDPDGNPITAVKVTDPVHGTLTLNADGSFTYTHDGGETTSDSFTYRAFDGLNYGNVATVSFVINPVNDRPVVTNITKSGPEDNIITFTQTDFTGSFTDADGNSLSQVMITSLPLNGTLRYSGINISVSDEIPFAVLANLTFTPNLNWNGNTSFGWNGNDGTAYALSAATVNITITAVNDSPVVSDITRSVNEDNTLTFVSGDFTGAYTDIDGNPLSRIRITSLPLNGTLSLSGINVSVNDVILVSGIGNLTFTPDANWNGNTSFTWNGSDGTVYALSGATVFISVNPMNDLPLVTNITRTGTENNPVTFTQADFTGSFTDIDGNSLSRIMITSLPLNGTLRLSGTNVSVNDEIPVAGLGNLTFTPDASWNGNTTFGWNGNDGTSYALSAATVTITINPVNDPPVVSDITKSVNEDNTLTFTSSDFTAAFTDIDGNSLARIMITGLPLNGILKISGVNVSLNDEIPQASLGNLTFTPDANWNGNTSFGWNGSDGLVYANTAARVLLTVNPVNDIPVLSTINKSVDEDKTLTFTGSDFTAAFTDIDGTTLVKIMITGLPAHGTLRLSGTDVELNDEILLSDLPNLTFVPDTHWAGNTSFTWNGFDGTSFALADATVNITVNAVNNPPTIANISKSVNEDNIMNFSASDFTGAFNDIDGNSMSKIKITSLPANGVLKLSGVAVNVNDEIPTSQLANLTFTPDPDWYGNTHFGWNGYDGTAYSLADAQVNLTVITVNDPPVINQTLIRDTMNENGGAHLIDLTGNSTDVDGNTLTTSLLHNPAHGTATINSSGNVIYTPNSNFAGNDTIDYQVCDNGTPQMCASGRIIITVNSVAPANHAPAITDMNVSTVQNEPYTFKPEDFTSVFSDSDNDTLAKIQITSLTSSGVLKLNGVPLTTGQEIPWNQIGLLVYYPPSTYEGGAAFMWKASDGKDYSASASGVINVTRAEQFIPEGFSPNGDGINDFFVIKGIDGKTASLSVYNRWGNLVYSSRDYQNDWDGLANTGLLLGSKLPDGTYFYVLDLHDGEKAKIGYITINR